MRFDKQQTFTPSKTSPFDYDLFDIMNRPELGVIIKDDRGKPFKVIQTKLFNAFYDVDDYYKGNFSEGFKTIQGKCCLVVVREYYPPKSFANQIYRKQYASYKIRIA